ncbi:PREDICTED: programmed cell death protein 5 [Pterocles gutturalis]|nr:PREDICTED: programmed cell death protein 5 [Pterocles gutturalis]
MGLCRWSSEGISHTRHQVACPLCVVSCSRFEVFTIEFEVQIQHKVQDPSGDPSQQEAKQREAEIRNTILAQVLDQAARARLSNLALVKPDKAKAVENYLIQMARFGQLGGKVSEQGLIEILEKVSQQTEKKTTVKFNRRKVLDSDEEDDY